MRFSANLGFLWAELPLPEAIRAARQAGFDAVECHWPYETPAADLNAALRETGLPMLALNTRRGDAAAQENGLAALPGREREARAAIDEALDYAAQIGAKAVHVMAGAASGDEAGHTFRQNLRHACSEAHKLGITVLIEPLNLRDAPGYFLSDTAQARSVIEQTGAENLRLMFDCYHVQISEGDVGGRLAELMPLIGHIQFASVPDRGPPGTGAPDYARLFSHIEALGYDRPLGAEYKPRGPTQDTLGWMSRYRNGTCPHDNLSLP